LEPSQCLELIAGEFLATYEALGGKEQDDEPEEPAPGPKEEAGAAPPDDTLMCPEGEELPSPVAAPYSKTHRRVLERDAYCCKYPGCSGRMNLHLHHVEYRSRSGTKAKAASNSAGNLLCLCHVHHRMVHAGIIGVKGKAPDQLEWRRPKLMEEAAARAAESCETLGDLGEDEPEGPEGEDDEVWLPAGYSPSWDEPVAARSR
jgi:hypothetical protein